VAFVCLIRIHLHLPTGGSLKGKRKELLSLKAGLQRRFGAAVSETDHHELWQRSTLSAALVGRNASQVRATADRLERWVDTQFPDGVRIERGLLSVDELIG
jgi:uncharacterized protein YlxP (DUF503 family)